MHFRIENFFQRHLKLSINQNQHLLKLMWVLSSLYNEDVQFADCLNVHPPKKKKKKKKVFVLVVSSLVYPCAS